MEHDKNNAQASDDEWVSFPTLTLDQVRVMHDAERAGDPERMQAIIEDAWAMLDQRGLECPPVETMQALWTLWRVR